MRLAHYLATLGLVLLLAVAAACGGDDAGDTAGSGDAGAADADAGAGGDDGSADVGEGADEADGATAADGDGSADGATDSPDGGEADGADTGDEAVGADGPTVDPSIEVPEWVEVVGVEEALNVRAGPSSSFDRVAQIPPGETLRVLGGTQSDEGGLWLQVVIGGDTEGWVFAQYTSEIARPTPTPLPTPTPVGTPTPLPVEEGEDGDGDDDGEAGGQSLRVVAPDGLNLRDAPGLDSNVIAELDDGDRLEGTGRTQNADGRNWTEVRVGGQTGWVASEFVR